MTTSIATATILSCYVLRVRNAVEALNKRARKLRAAPYEIEVGAPYFRTIHLGSGRKRVDEVVDVAVTGMPVKFDGWTFVAKLDFLSDDACGVVISKAPGFESLSIERPDATRCDHCHAARRRAVCYVVQNESGARKVVGSSCLTDFTGMGRNVERLVALGFVAASVLDGAEEWGSEGGGSRSRADDLVEYLEAVAGMIRCYGWMSRGQARERGVDRATADTASGWAAMEHDKRRAHFPELGARTNRSDRAVALLAVHWCDQIDARNDYEENIVAISRSGYVLPKHLGLAASIVSAWQRHREALVRRAAMSKSDPNAVCGIVGKRSDFAVLVAGARQYESDYGLKTRVSLVDVATGAAMIWWCSGECPTEIWDATKPRPESDPPPVLTIKATVKKHDTYEDRRQTVVQRLVMTRPKPPKKTRAKKAANVVEEKECA